MANVQSGFSSGPSRAASHEGLVSDADVVPFLRDTLVHGGRVVVERDGLVYELVADRDHDLVVVLRGPESGA